MFPISDEMFAAVTISIPAPLSGYTESKEGYLLSPLPPSASVPGNAVNPAPDLSL